MANTLDYYIKNEKGEWGNIIHISSFYSKELHDEIGLEYDKPVEVTKDMLGAHLGAAKELYKENETFLKQCEEDKKEWQDILSKAQTDAAADKAIDMINEIKGTIHEAQEFMNVYNSIIIALSVLEQSENLTIEYIYG